MKPTLKVAVTAQAPKSGWRVDDLCAQVEQAARLGSCENLLAIVAEL